MQKGDLKHRAFLFSLKVLKSVDVMNSKEMSTKEIAKQLIRSATSIGANIVEAHGGKTKKDFGNFFHIALKSANETKYWLALLRESKKIKREEADSLLQEVMELSKILGASLATMYSKRKAKEDQTS